MNRAGKPHKTTHMYEKRLLCAPKCGWQFWIPSQMMDSRVVPAFRWKVKQGNRIMHKIKRTCSWCGLVKTHSRVSAVAAPISVGMVPVKELLSSRLRSQSHGRSQVLNDANQICAAACCRSCILSRWLRRKPDQPGHTKAITSELHLPSHNLTSIVCSKWLQGFTHIVQAVFPGGLSYDKGQTNAILESCMVQIHLISNTIRVSPSHCNATFIEKYSSSSQRR